MIGRCGAWHARMDLVKNTRSDDIGCVMPSSPLDNTYSRMMSSVTCHNRAWAEHTAERCQELHTIIILGQLERSDYVWHGMPSSPLDRIQVGHGMPALLLGRTQGPRTSVWHAIIALGQQTWSDDVGRGRTTWPMGSTHDHSGMP